MTTAKPDFVLVGEVLKPHGIRGELRVACYAQSPFLFDVVPCVYLRPGPGAPAPQAPGGQGRGGTGKARPKPVAKLRGPTPPRPVKITSWRVHKEFVLMTFEGVADRNAAEVLRGQEILVREADLPAPDEGELFVYELEGMTVLLADGSRLGHIAQVLMPGGQEIWSIETDDGREVLFPVAEEFITAVDSEADTVTIAPPAGLLELYLEGDEAK